MTGTYILKVFNMNLFNRIFNQVERLGGRMTNPDNNGLCKVWIATDDIYDELFRAFSTTNPLARFINGYSMESMSR